METINNNLIRIKLIKYLIGGHLHGLSSSIARHKEVGTYFGYDESEIWNKSQDT
jgi:hypothetical protein